MLKTFCSLLLLASLTAIAGFAVPVLAPPSPPCSGFGVGPPNDISIPFATWTAANFNCEQQDKIFSNFSVSGLPTNTVLEVQEQALSPFDFHGVTFNGNFLAGFTVSYDIAIDLVLSPNNRIVRVSGDLSNPSDVGNPANVKQIFLESGAAIGSLTSMSGSPGTPIITSVTSLHVIDTYTPNGGAAVSVSNVFAEQAVPEPASAILIGLGLFGISRVKRRSFRNFSA